MLGLMNNDANRLTQPSSSSEDKLSLNDQAAITTFHVDAERQWSCRQQADDQLSELYD